VTYPSWFAETKWRKTTRQTLLQTQGDCCAICGGGFTEDGEGVPTLEHVIPVAMGGAYGLGNVVLAHWACNNRKGDQRPTGCELIWLMLVNTRLGVHPQRW
jgi:5-methylcytosine-specific restriction endonuclease McrA